MERGRYLTLHPYECDLLRPVMLPPSPSPPIFLALGTQQWWHHREANVSGDQYAYTDDLVALQQCLPRLTQPGVTLGFVVSPLSDRLGAWSHALVVHLDTVHKEYILSGLRQGFRVGFDDTNHSCQPAKRNLTLVASRPAVVQVYIEKECAAGRVLGPFPPGSVLGLQISSFVVFPKGHTWESGI